MKKKKIIVICAFLFLIFVTAIFTIVSVVKSYQYDMDPANSVDIMEGMGAALLIIIGGFVVLYELDLFYTVYYFLIKPKTIAKSILNILANLSLLLSFFNDFYKDIFSEDIIAPLIVFAIYVVLRITCFMVPNRELNQKGQSIFFANAIKECNESFARELMLEHLKKDYSAYLEKTQLL